MKIRTLMILVAGLFILASCTRPLCDRVEQFVNKTEANYEKYSEEDWQKSLDEFKALSREYKNNKQSLSKEESERIVKALRKYSVLVLNKGIFTVGDLFQESLESMLPSLKGAFESMESEE